MRIRPSRVLKIALGLALITVVAAICLHSYMEALLRSVAKRPLGDMRALGTALEGYRKAHGEYPLISPRRPAEVLAPYLVPAFLSSIPAEDNWGHPFLVTASSEHYEIWSLGRDGKDGPNITDGPTDTWECDVLLRDGQFLRYPRSAINQ